MKRRLAGVLVSGLMAGTWLTGDAALARNQDAGATEQNAGASDARPGDPGAASRVVDFAARLAAGGPRPAASDGEARVRAVVAAELEAVGLTVTIEPFEYQSFVLQTTKLSLGGNAADPLVLGLDPFAGRFAFSGEAVVVTDPAQAAAALNGRIVVTNHPLMQLMIAEHDPAVVISVAPEVLDDFVARGDARVELVVEGTPVTLHSANLVARRGGGPAGRPEVLVTSHLDAYQDSPGANDNGTGLGAMIELARTGAGQAGEGRIGLAFVAFGAEENGAIGSRAYIERHANELDRIVAVVNLDTLGGARGPVIATKPPERTGPVERPGCRIPEGLRGRAWEGPEGRWRMVHPEIVPTVLTSTFPDWLQQTVAESAAALGIDAFQLDLISDHRSFAHAGVPAISVQSKEHRIHSRDDTADGLVPETVARCVGLAAEIVARLRRGAGEDGDGLAGHSREPGARSHR